jgi:hypothetical protein
VGTFQENLFAKETRKSIDLEQLKFFW